LAQVPAPSFWSSDVVPEIEAKVWLNPQPARLYPKSVYALVVFWSSTSPLPAPMVKSVNDLHLRHRDGRLMVVGLSEDKAKRVEQVLRRDKIKFKVGAESRSAKKFGVTETPAVVLVDLKSREIRWKAQGAQLEAQTLRRAVTDLLGDPEGHDRSARLAAEEDANRSLAATRGAAAEVEVATITEEILSDTAEQPWIEPEDLAALDEFYERHLPSDPDRPGARSENLARMYAMGQDGDKGYGGLYKSGRLSDASKAYVRERLLSIAQEDPSQRQSTLNTLRLQVGADASDALDEMRAMRAAEPDRWVRAAWDQTIDSLDPSPSPEVQARLHRPKHAWQLGRMLKNEANPRESRWSDAQAYYETRIQRSTAELLADYRSFSDSEDEALRENAVLKRSFSIETIAERSEQGKTADVPGLATGLLETLGSESDHLIRTNMVEALLSLAKRASPNERQQVVSGLERHLPAESDPYLVRPMVEQAIEDLRAIP
jgi:hypothetical protein